MKNGNTEPTNSNRQEATMASNALHPLKSRRDQIVNALDEAGYAIQAGATSRSIYAVQPSPEDGDEARGHVEQIAELLRLEGAEGAECMGRSRNFPMRGFTTYRFRLLGPNEPI